MEEMKNVKIAENEEEVKESKFKEFASKVGAGIKKHGKKVAAVAAIGTIGVIGYVLLKKSIDVDAGELVEDAANVIDIADYSQEVAQ